MVLQHLGALLDSRIHQLGGAQVCQCGISWSLATCGSGARRFLGCRFVATGRSDDPTGWTTSRWRSLCGACCADPLWAGDAGTSSVVGTTSVAGACSLTGACSVAFACSRSAARRRRTSAARSRTAGGLVESELRAASAAVAAGTPIRHGSSRRCPPRQQCLPADPQRHQRVLLPGAACRWSTDHRRAHALAPFDRVDASPGHPHSARPRSPCRPTTVRPTIGRRPPDRW